MNDKELEKLRQEVRQIIDEEVQLLFDELREAAIKAFDEMCRLGGDPNIHIHYTVEPEQQELPL